MWFMSLYLKLLQCVRPSLILRVEWAKADCEVGDRVPTRIEALILIFINFYSYISICQKPQERYSLRLV